MNAQEEGVFKTPSLSGERLQGFLLVLAMLLPEVPPVLRDGHDTDLIISGSDEGDDEAAGAQEVRQAAEVEAERVGGGEKCGRGGARPRPAQSKEEEAKARGGEVRGLLMQVTLPLIQEGGLRGRELLPLPLLPAPDPFPVMLLLVMLVLPEES